MKRLFFLFLLLVTAVSILHSQSVLFRTGRFLHHSTGGCIWGPNGSATSVPLQMTAYNTLHGYTGQYAVSMTESGWPETPWDNEWERWHRIFENKDTVLADIRPILLNNKIVVIKSCFPSSSITGIGVPSDTLSPTNKTIYNYKWHWRHLINRMKTRPQNFFVIWTNAPLVAGATNINAARWSKQFCKWAKDTLAAGLDPVIGSFPQNVYVFDFFSKLTDTTGYMLAMYAASSSDSHPNAAATTLVAPLFVQEIFNHSIAYESIYAGILKMGTEIPSSYSLNQSYPNPFNPSTKITFKIPSWEGYGFSRGVGLVSLRIYDITGREVQTLVNEELQPGAYEVTFDGSGLNSGVYFYQLRAGDPAVAGQVFTQTRKMLLIK
jgi:hypothetical protein